LFFHPYTEADSVEHKNDREEHENRKYHPGSINVRRDKDIESSSFDEIQDGECGDGGERVQYKESLQIKQQLGKSNVNDRIDPESNGIVEVGQNASHESKDKGKACILFHNDKEDDYCGNFNCAIERQTDVQGKNIE
jgi:hypothetical protein